MLSQAILVCSSHQPFCFHILAGSLSSPKKSTPLESSKSRLFFQNTRGGGTAKIASLESTTSRLFFPALFASQLRPRLRSLSLRPGASLASQSGPLCFNLCVNSAPSAPLRYPFSSVFVFVAPARCGRPLFSQRYESLIPQLSCFHIHTKPQGCPQLRHPRLGRRFCQPTQISPSVFGNQAFRLLLQCLGVAMCNFCGFPAY